MKKYLPIILTGAAAIFFYFFSRTQAAKNLKIYFRDLQLKKIKGKVLPEIFARFTINNGSNTPLSINSIVGDITVNGSALSSVSQFEKMTIPANSASVLNLKIQTPALNVAQVVYSMFGKKQSVTVGFEGTVNSNGILIPISQSVKMF